MRICPALIRPEVYVTEGKKELLRLGIGGFFLGSIRFLWTYGGHGLMSNCTEVTYNFFSHLGSQKRFACTLNVAGQQWLKEIPD